MTKTPEDVGRILDVSRETLDRLQVYVDTLIKWQNSINLVGPKTIDDIWERHILDSGQIFSLTGFRISDHGYWLRCRLAWFGDRDHAAWDMG